MDGVVTEEEEDVYKVDNKRLFILIFSRTVSGNCVAKSFRILIRSIPIPLSRHVPAVTDDDNLVVVVVVGAATDGSGGEGSVVDKETVDDL